MALLVFQRSFPSVPFGAPLTTTKMVFPPSHMSHKQESFEMLLSYHPKKKQFENEGNFPRGRKTEILPPFPCVGAEMEGWERRRWRRSLGIANLFARTYVHRNGNGIPPTPAPFLYSPNDAGMPKARQGNYRTISCCKIYCTKSVWEGEGMVISCS